MSDETDDGIQVRAMSAADAAGVAELVRTTYGEDYVHEEIYLPERFFAAQERGEHISEVAVAPDGRVVGHWAFTFHGPRVAESGMTITHPDFRGHGIATRMEENLLRRLDELGVRWIMGEPVLFHTATQQIVTSDWREGAITGFRLNAFHHVDSVKGFDGDMESGRVSVATAFGPLTAMEPREVWVPDSYAGLLTTVLESSGWPRTILTDGTAAEGASVVESAWDDDNSSAQLNVRVIGADIREVVAAARDEAAGSGAKYIELRLPVSSPEAAGADLLDLGFSYAAFLPEMGDDGDVLLLQWLGDPSVDRDHWHLVNGEVEALADAIVAQASEAFERRKTGS